MASAATNGTDSASPRARVAAGAPRRSANSAHTHTASRGGVPAPAAKRARPSGGRKAPRPPEPKAASRRTWLRKAVQPVVGIEVDGTQVTAVAVLPGGASAMATARERTWQLSMEKVLGQMPAARAYRAVIVSTGARHAHLNVSAAHKTRAQFVEAARAALGDVGDGVEVAGWVFDTARLDAGLVTPGAAVSAPAEPIHALYQALPATAPTEVAAASLTAGPIEGLSLALRYTTAELTLVRDGCPLASAVLPTGGLSTVEAILGQGTVTGPARLAGAIAADRDDPMAARELDRYLRAVITDARAVIAGWERSGERVPRELYVYGPAARATGLQYLLSDAGLERATNGALVGALITVDPAERSAVVGAYLAAATHGHGAPQAIFVDPQAVAREARYRQRERARRRSKLTAAVVVAMLSAAAGPFAYVAAHDAVLSNLTAAAAQRASEATGLDPRQSVELATFVWAQGELTRTAVDAQLLKSVDDALRDQHAKGAAVDLRATAVTVSGNVDDPAEVTGIARALTKATRWHATASLLAEGRSYAYTIKLRPEETP